MTQLRALALVFSLMFASITCTAQPVAFKFRDNYDLLKEKKYAELDELYALGFASKHVSESSPSAGEIFFNYFTPRIRVGVENRTHDLDLASQWLRASPDSLAASLLHAYITLNLITAHAQYNLDWDAQERLIGTALEQLQKVKTAGNAHSMWHATYLRLLSLNGATPSQIVRLATPFLHSDAIAGQMFYEYVMIALAPNTSEARTQIRDLAMLASERDSASNGMRNYARIYLLALKHDYAMLRDPFGPDAIDWKTMDPALTDLRKGNSDFRLISNHAALACLAGDKTRAGELLTMTSKLEQSNPGNAPVNAAVWRYWGGMAAHNRCKTFAFGTQKPT